MLIVIKTLGNARLGPGGGREDDLRRPQLTFIDTAGPFVMTGRHRARTTGRGVSRVVSSTSRMLKLQKNVAELLQGPPSSSSYR